MSGITVVTPWLSHPELAADYVDAVAYDLRKGDACLIVDNGDAPADLPFVYVSPRINLGFVGGSNRGLSLAITDAVLFLNNDIELVRRGWLDEVREQLEPGVLVGPLRMAPHADVDGRSLPYIDGWFLAGMRADFMALGGFDAALAEPAYYSDNLLCLEARARGMRLRDHRPGLRHKLNATAGPASADSVKAATAANRARYVARARQLLVAA